MAVRHPMPGVTADMVNWWFAWHGLESLRYMFWSPKDHYAVDMTDEDRAKVLDPDRPLLLKFQGITHHVYEDIGGGADDLWISFMTPEDFGFDMSRWHESERGHAGGRQRAHQGQRLPRTTPRCMPVAMCHFVRRLPQGDGVEFRTRFWMGWQIVDKKPAFTLPAGVKFPESVPAGLFEHCILEYSNLRVLLPEIYAEMKGIVA